ncbi:MAG: hypothetical protein HW379_393, partial [Actinobacteria bacterium]|nr:hypothetical protein [Actinomycetota bacterium]
VYSKNAELIHKLELSLGQLTAHRSRQNYCAMVPEPLANPDVTG